MKFRKKPVVIEAIQFTDLSSINTEAIKALNPCKDRFDNYLTYYSDFNGTLEDFILLDNISYSDKVWVFTRLATAHQNVKWALLCASKVLSSLEAILPNDNRPRKALEAVEAYLNNPCSETALTAWSARSKAWSAAGSAAGSAAWAAGSAAWAASAAGSAEREVEEEVNLLLMIEALKEDGNETK